MCGPLPASWGGSLSVERFGVEKDALGSSKLCVEVDFPSKEGTFRKNMARGVEAKECKAKCEVGSGA